MTTASSSMPRNSVDRRNDADTQSGGQEGKRIQACSGCYIQHSGAGILRKAGLSASDEPGRLPRRRSPVALSDQAEFAINHDVIISGFARCFLSPNRALRAT